jgi:hypothetical protein
MQNKNQPNKREEKILNTLKLGDLKELENLYANKSKKQRLYNICIGALSFLVMFLVWEYFNYNF